MKKVLFLLLLAAAAIQVSAQYKKASFLNKDGRTYSLSTTLFNIGDGKGSRLGFTFSGGKDDPEKRVFAWYDFTYIPAFTYSYETNGYLGSATTPSSLTIFGKSRSIWIYGYNVGIYITKHDADSKFSAYVPIGFNFVIYGSSKFSSYDDETSQYSQIDKSPANSAFTFGFKTGLGGIYNISQKVGIKLEAGYNPVLNATIDPSDEHTSHKYYMFTSNSYVTLGLRLHIVDKD